MGWHGAWGPFCWFIPILFFALLFFGRFWFWGCGWGWRRRGWHGGRWEAEAILQRRLAAGEIDEAEYRRLREVLSK